MKKSIILLILCLVFFHSCTLDKPMEQQRNHDGIEIIEYKDDVALTRLGMGEHNWSALWYTNEVHKHWRFWPFWYEWCNKKTTCYLCTLHYGGHTKTEVTHSPLD